VSVLKSDSETESSTTLIDGIVIKIDDVDDDPQNDNDLDGM
jgi:hypothetical protein